MLEEARTKDKSIDEIILDNILSYIPNTNIDESKFQLEILQNVVYKTKTTLLEALEMYHRTMEELLTEPIHKLYENDPLTNFKLFYETNLENPNGFRNTKIPPLSLEKQKFIHSTYN